MQRTCGCFFFCLKLGGGEKLKGPCGCILVYAVQSSGVDGMLRAWVRWMWVTVGGSSRPRSVGQLYTRQVVAPLGRSRERGRGVNIYSLTHLQRLISFLKNLFHVSLQCILLVFASWCYRIIPSELYCTSTYIFITFVAIRYFVTPCPPTKNRSLAHGRAPPFLPSSSLSSFLMICPSSPRFPTTFALSIMASSSFSASLALCSSPLNFHCSFLTVLSLMRNACSVRSRPSLALASSGLAVDKSGRVARCSRIVWSRRLSGAVT